MKKIILLLTITSLCGVVWGGFYNVGDDLGNHKATRDLNMSSYSVVNASTITVLNNFIVGGSTFVVKGGNVGIGITAPTTLLHIKKDSPSGDIATFRMEDLGTFTIGNSGFGDIGLNSIGSPCGVMAHSGGKQLRVGGNPILFGSNVGGNYIEIMRISTNTNVGINTTTPREKLDVNGSIIATSSITAQGGIYTSDVFANNVFADNINQSTTTLSNKIDEIALSTGTLVKKSGDTMIGDLNINNNQVINVSTLTFSDGTMMVSTSNLSGITIHSQLSGLTFDDHPQYISTASYRGLQYTEGPIYFYYDFIEAGNPRRFYFTYGSGEPFFQVGLTRAWASSLGLYKDIGNTFLALLRIEDIYPAKRGISWGDTWFDVGFHQSPRYLQRGIRIFGSGYGGIEVNGTYLKVTGANASFFTGVTQHQAGLQTNSIDAYTGDSINFNTKDIINISTVSAINVYANNIQQSTTTLNNKIDAVAISTGILSIRTADGVKHDDYVEYISTDTITIPPDSSYDVVLPVSEIVNKQVCLQQLGNNILDCYLYDVWTTSFTIKNANTGSSAKVIWRAVCKE